MTLVIILNAILALGVTVMVVSPLVWAIFTQHRDAPEVHLSGRRHPRLATQKTHGARSRQLEPVAQPA